MKSIHCTTLENHAMVRIACTHKRRSQCLAAAMLPHGYVGIFENGLQEVHLFWELAGAKC